MNTSSSTNLFLERPAIFLEAIYGNQLGQLRVEQILDDLEHFLTQHEVTTIVDIGAGHAPVTLTLLSRHPNLRAHLVEPSAELIAQAKINAEQLEVAADRVTYQQTELAEYIASGGHDGELVLCHAVVNWTVDPRQFIADLTSHCASRQQWVSLVFGGSSGKSLRFATQGNMADLLTSVQFPGSLVGSFSYTAQVKPLDPTTVQTQLVDAGCEIVLQAGVRIFADYVPPAVLNNDQSFAVLRQAENLARRDERYWRLGQLVHFIYRKT